MLRKIPVVILLASAGILLFSGLVMLLWNGILPAVLHVGAITIWQAAGILLLCKLLFGRGRGHGWRGGHKKRMFMKWQAMSPEERSRMRRFGCYGGRYDDNKTAEQTMA